MVSLHPDLAFGHPQSETGGLGPWRRVEAGRFASLRRWAAGLGPAGWVCGLVSLLVTWPSAVAAQTNTIDSWLARQETVRTWSADFVQTRKLQSLTVPLTAQGRVWFAAPDRFRWELGTPPRTIVVRQPDQMSVIYPLLKRVERYPLTQEQGGQWGSALALLEAGFPRSRADLESKFRLVSETPQADLLRVRLEPKAPSARKLIPRIDLVLSILDNSLQATELEFPDGSTMRNDFSNAKVNPAIDEGLFRSEVASDFKVVEPLKR